MRWAAERRGWLSRWRTTYAMDRPAFINRTCTRCGGRFSLDPSELRNKPAPAPVWKCSACRRATGRTVNNLLGLLKR